MSNVFRNYIFIYYRNNHKCIYEQSKIPKKRKLKKKKKKT